MNTRLFKKKNPLRISEYLTTHAVRKLQIGSGLNILEGWLNSDLNPSADAVSVDATKTFPFVEGSFDYVYSEHMIEHIDYKTGVQMLAECYRVLGPGGKVRIATPDLAFLIELYRKSKTALQKAYINWATDWFIENAPAYEDTFVINNFMRAWGHTFIYDEKVLRYAMARVGFMDTCRCELRQSSDPELRGLEHERRLPKGFLRLETLVLEGTKPVYDANGKARRRGKAS